MYVFMYVFVYLFINFRRSYLGLSKVRLSPRLWTRFSTDLDETLEIDLEYYHTTFSKSKKNLNTFMFLLQSHYFFIRPF
jgi:hypothetical protein